MVCNTEYQYRRNSVMKNRRILITALPLVLVNLVAISGQYAFIREHTAWPIYGVVIFAAAIEAVSVYLAYMAHESLMQNDSAMRLRLAAYAFGLIAGIMNYSHYAPDGRITFVAFATGLMSASSPWLWSVHSRRASRDALMSAGLIEPHAVRLGVTRWIWHPVKSTRVMYMATWQGEQSPQAAISAYENTRLNPEPVISEPVISEPAEPEPEPASTEPARAALPGASSGRMHARARTGSKAAIVRDALNDAPGDSAPAIAARLAERGVSVSPAYVRQVKSVSARREVMQRRTAIRALAPGASSGYAATKRNQDE
jgi:hypothetical protein